MKCLSCKAVSNTNNYRIIIFIYAFPKGLEHLMHNLDIGGLEFPEKHTLDHHRQNEYNGNGADNDDDSSRFSTNMTTPDVETTTRSGT